MHAFFIEVEEVRAETGAKIEFILVDNSLDIFVSLAGQAPGKSRCRKALTRFCENAGFEVESNIFQNVTVDGVAQRQLGQLISDLAVYLDGGAGAGNSTAPNPNHCDIAIKVDWLSDAREAVYKSNKYFAPGFLGPNNTIINEVWNVLLPDDEPAAPQQGYNQPQYIVPWSAVQPLPLAGEPVLTGVPFVLPPVGAAVFPGGLPALPVLIMQQRNNALFPPTLYQLQWNSRLQPPPESLLAGLDIRMNYFLRETFRM
jgi:hypothetical protein